MKTNIIIIKIIFRNSTLDINKYKIGLKIILENLNNNNVKMFEIVKISIKN